MQRYTKIPSDILQDIISRIKLVVCNTKICNYLIRYILITMAHIDEYTIMFNPLYSMRLKYLIRPQNIINFNYIWNIID